MINRPIPPAVQNMVIDDISLTQHNFEAENQNNPNSYLRSNQARYKGQPGGNTRLESHQLLALAQSHLTKNSKRERDYTLGQEDHRVNDTKSSRTNDSIYRQLHGLNTKSPEETGNQQKDPDTDGALFYQQKTRIFNLNIKDPTDSVHTMNNPPAYLIRK